MENLPNFYRLQLYMYLNIKLDISIFLNFIIFIGKQAKEYENISFLYS